LGFYVFASAWPDDVCVVVRSGLNGAGHFASKHLMCYSACNFGSDSLLMKFGFSLMSFHGENQHHAVRPSAVGARA
jgi:hypothetical protein